MRMASVVVALVVALSAVPAAAWATPAPATAATSAAEAPTTTTAAPTETASAPATQGPIAAALSPAAEPKLVAVLDLKAGVGAEATAAAMTTMLTAEVSAIDGFKGISRNEIKSILSHSADAQLAGCN